MTTIIFSLKIKSAEKSSTMSTNYARLITNVKGISDLMRKLLKTGKSNTCERVLF
jgi:hypothetical protein